MQFLKIIFSVSFVKNDLPFFIKGILFFLNRHAIIASEKKKIAFESFCTFREKCAVKLVIDSLVDSL